MDNLPTAIMIAISSFMILRFLQAKRGRTSGPEARAAVEQGAVLLDVRSPGEYASGSLPRAKNIPVGSLRSRTDELDEQRDVVVFCASGMRSSRAASLLRDQGFTVHDLGSIRAW